MKWTHHNGVHELSLSHPDITELKKGAVITLKTEKDELIIIKRD